MGPRIFTRLLPGGPAPRPGERRDRRDVQARTWLESPGNASENYGNEERYKALNEERFPLMRAIEDKFTLRTSALSGEARSPGSSKIRFAPREARFESVWIGMYAAFGSAHREQAKE